MAYILQYREGEQVLLFYASLVVEISIDVGRDAY